MNDLRWKLLLFCVVGYAAMVGCSDSSKPRLLVYCAASMRPAVQPIADAHEERTGVRVDLQFSGSNLLLNQITLSNRGDAFIAADRLYLDQAGERGLAAAAQNLRDLHAVLLTREPPVESTLRAILDREPRLAIGNPEAAAIGRATKQVLEDAALWEPVDALVRRSGVYTPTVEAAAQAVEIGSVDAAIVWGVTAERRPALHVARLPELAGVTATVAVARLACSPNATLADAFIAEVVGVFSAAKASSRLASKVVEP